MGLAGRYTLEKHGIYDKTGVFHPTAERLKGELIYGQDYSLALLILTGDIGSPLQIYLAYTGTYEIVSEHKILHHISLSSAENKNNTTETRMFFKDETSVVLSAFLKNENKFLAVWKKV